MFALTVRFRTAPAKRPPRRAPTVQMLAPASGAQALLNGFTDIPPGAGIPLHLHHIEESVLIVPDEALVEVDGETRRIAVEHGP